MKSDFVDTCEGVRKNVVARIATTMYHIRKSLYSLCVRDELMASLIESLNTLLQAAADRKVGGYYPEPVWTTLCKYLTGTNLSNAI